MLAASMVKMSSSAQKKKRTGTQVTNVFVSTYDISSIKLVTGKFHVVVVQQQQQRNVQKSVMHMQSSFFFLLIRPFDCSYCHRRLA